MHCNVNFIVRIHRNIFHFSKEEKKPLNPSLSGYMAQQNGIRHFAKRPIISPTQVFVPYTGFTQFLVRRYSIGLCADYSRTRKLKRMFIEMLQYGHRNLTVSSDSLAPVQTSPPQTSSEAHHHWHHFNQDIATGETDQDVFSGPSSGDTP